MKNPILSIIVPVYKVERYLCKCIDSILNQPFGDFELILVDDGSPDRSGKICDEYAVKDSRIIVLHKENGGLSSARNAGLDMATGEYIHFIDSDDYISNDLYAENIPLLLKDATIDILVFPMYFDEGGKLIKYEIPNLVPEAHLYNKQDFYALMSHGGDGVIGFIPQNIYNKKLFQNVRFKEGMLFEDCYIQCFLLEEIKHMFISDKGQYFYVQREGSILHSEWTIQKSVGDYEATITYLEKMVKYNVKKELIVKCYCALMGRMIDNSYIWGHHLFLCYFGRLEKVPISFFDLIRSPLSFKQKVKLNIFRTLGPKRYLAIASKTVNRSFSNRK